LANLQTIDWLLEDGILTPAHHNTKHSYIIRHKNVLCFSAQTIKFRLQVANQLSEDLPAINNARAA